MLRLRRHEIAADAVQGLAVVLHPRPANVTVDAGSGYDLAVFQRRDHHAVRVFHAGQRPQIDLHLGGDEIVHFLKLGLDAVVLRLGGKLAAAHRRQITGHGVAGLALVFKLRPAVVADADTGGDVAVFQLGDYRGVPHAPRWGACAGSPRPWRSPPDSPG